MKPLLPPSATGYCAYPLECRSFYTVRVSRFQQYTITIKFCVANRAARLHPKSKYEHVMQTRRRLSDTLGKRTGLEPGIMWHRGSKPHSLTALRYVPSLGSFPVASSDEFPAVRHCSAGRVAKKCKAPLERFKRWCPGHLFAGLVRRAIVNATYREGSFACVLANSCFPCSHGKPALLSVALSHFYTILCFPVSIEFAFSYHEA